ncbi:hypothetical protein Shyd_26850 [Streptomyces hydrogenans]|uniref:Uncharacterized protein n=1 Tax=Streptomyces hydrogenans TaxID=1873719 RepID=A0ABQ3P8I8_9ACTN|nr:hypothetical protein GCM10018784_77820 [Streptomyces hydrogenans]GHI21314.1 hypothetical protein Shyd_26850 [Streptomyces hydrogenans]
MRGGPAGLLRRAGRAAVLLPVAVATTGLVAAGRADRAAEWWARIGGEDPAAVRRPGAGRLLGHALVCVPLGLIALVPVGVEVLSVLRGLLYPLVESGPYDHSWGGPTLAGAWAAHFLVALPFAAAGLGVLALLHRLHHRLAGRLWGRRVGAGPVLVTLVTALACAVLVVAWTHQL